MTAVFSVEIDQYFLVDIFDKDLVLIMWMSIPRHLRICCKGHRHGQSTNNRKKLDVP